LSPLFSPKSLHYQTGLTVGPFRTLSANFWLPFVAKVSIPIWVAMGISP